MILCDYTALVEVTDEMRRLRECPDCHADWWDSCMECQQEFVNETWRKRCPVCYGTGLNPDQSAWWEALSNIRPDHDSMGGEIIRAFVNPVIFCEFPIVYDDVETCLFEAFGTNHRVVHRPSGDNRPWPEVLRNLVYTEICRGGKHEHKRSYLEGGPMDVVVPISFALTTPETANVFKSFGIETIGRL